MKVRAVIKPWEADRWRLDRMRGSHRQDKHPTNVVTVADKVCRHAGRDDARDLARGGVEAVTRMRYAVVIERGETSYGAYVPGLSGCVAVAETREEVEQLIQEAIVFHLEGMQRAGLSISEPTSDAMMIDVSPPMAAD